MSTENPTSLTKNDENQLVEALLNPAEPNAALRRAFSRPELDRERLKALSDRLVENSRLTAEIRRWGQRVDALEAELERLQTLPDCGFLKPNEICKDLLVAEKQLARAQNAFLKFLLENPV